MNNFSSIASNLMLACESLNRAAKLLSSIAPLTESTTQNSLPADELEAQAEAAIAAERHPGRPGIRIEDNIDPHTATPTVTPSPAPSLDKVRAALTRLCQRGFAADAKTIIGHYGVAKLPDVDPKYYSDLLAEVMTFETSHITTDKVGGNQHE